VRLLVPGPESASAEKLFREWSALGQIKAAPNLIGYEVTNALLRYRGAGVLTGDEMHTALGYFLSLDIQLMGDAALHKRALEFALEYALPAAYDAHYLALAERLGAELWTVDRKLVNRLSDKLAWVRLAI